MDNGHEPSEKMERPVTVILLYDDDQNDRIPHASYSQAIQTVRERGPAATVAKIEAADGEVVFRSDDMDIDDWENEWKRAKRTLSVNVDERDCPYENVGCVADDLCVQCKMDSVQDSY